MTTRDKKDDRAETKFHVLFIDNFFFCLVADAWRENLFTSMKGLYTGLLNPKAKRRHRFQLASYSMCDELNTFVDLYVAF